MPASALDEPHARYAGKLADPEFRRQRAANAARSRTTTDAHVRAVIARAGQLTAEHIAELRAILPPVPPGGSARAHA